MPKPITSSVSDSNAVSRTLLAIVSRIPASGEPTSPSPKVRARAIASSAAMRAAGVSGAMALPPGPFGLATILPDLFAIWHLQQSMVADIAAAFGKSAFLQKEAMTHCLFKHGSAAVVRDIVTRVGERYLICQTTLKAIQQMLQKVGVRITQRVIEKGISRWIPILGALAVGAYAYYDTAQVAATAIELFSKDIELEDTKEKKGNRA
jgi:hypothetical protein